MIYTTFELIRDCRDNRPEGWEHFELRYASILREFVRHYFPDRFQDSDSVVASAREIVRGLQPVPERQFVAELRQHVVRSLRPDDHVSAPPEELAGLPLLHQQASWLEGMGYGADDIFRMARTRTKPPVSVPRATALASWAPGERCAAVRTLLDMIDGRATWQVREAVEHHMTRCTYCLDHYCRLLEVVDLLRRSG